MWEQRTLQRALLGQPAFGDPIQIAFGATHIDRRQLAVGAPETERRARGKWLARIAQLPLHANRRRLKP